MMQLSGRMYSKFEASWQQDLAGPRRRGLFGDFHNGSYDNAASERRLLLGSANELCRDTSTSDPPQYASLIYSPRSPNCYREFHI
jgi:hypothetical protein